MHAILIGTVSHFLVCLHQWAFSTVSGATHVARRRSSAWEAEPAWWTGAAARGERELRR